MTEHKPDSGPVTLVENRRARPLAPWTAAQNAILNDAALARARQTIGAWDGYGETPLYPLRALAARLGVAAIDYKDESVRFGLGSFKALGGAYAVARVLSRRTGLSLADIVAGREPEAVAGLTVCCATDGNHGRSVAWGAQRFGCRCVIFIHATVSEGRREAIARYGAEVRRTAGNYDDSVREAEQTAQDEGWTVVSDTSYPGYMEIPRDVMQGYEVMVDEAFKQAAQPPTHIFLQTGVGGMAAAVTALAKRRFGAERPIIVLTDPDQSACWVESYRAGKPTAIEGDLDTLMAGLACGEVSSLAWEILQDHGDAAMALPDDAAVAMMRQMANPVAGDPPIVAGESAVAGLAGLAAAMQDPSARVSLNLTAESRIMVFGTEGDTDPELYESLVGRSAAAIIAARQAAH